MVALLILLSLIHCIVAGPPPGSTGQDSAPIDSRHPSTSQNESPNAPPYSGDGQYSMSQYGPGSGTQQNGGYAPSHHPPPSPYGGSASYGAPPFPPPGGSASYGAPPLPPPGGSASYSAPPPPHAAQQGYPQGYPPQHGYPPQGYPPQHGYPPQGYPPQQGYPQQGYPPHQPPHQHYQTTHQPLFMQKTAENSWEIHPIHPPPLYWDENLLKHIGCDSATIHRNDKFNPVYAAKELYNALMGKHTKDGMSEGQVIFRLLQGNNAQRQFMLNYLQHEAKMPVEKFIQKRLPKLKADFTRAVKALMKTPEVYDAEQLQEAFNDLNPSYLATLSPLWGDKKKRNIQQILEILLTRTKSQIYLINVKYKELAKGKTLQMEIEKVNGLKEEDDLKNLLQLLCNPNALVPPGVPMNALVPPGVPMNALVPPGALENIKEMAMEHFENGFQNEKNNMNQILSLIQQDPNFLKEIFAKYENKNGGKQIEATQIVSQSDYYKTAFKSLVKAAKNRAAFLAEEIYDSVACMGTHDNDLTRQIITRAECDLGGIRAAYTELYKLKPPKNTKKESLEKVVKGEISGDYQRIIIGLIMRSGTNGSSTKVEYNSN